MINFNFPLPNPSNNNSPQMTNGHDKINNQDFYHFHDLDQ